VSTLDDILSDPQTYWVQDLEGDFVKYDMTDSRSLDKRLIKKLVQEIIGDDEPILTNHSKVSSANIKRKGRNQLRRELRSKVEEL